MNKNEYLQLNLQNNQYNQLWSLTKLYLAHPC